MALEATIDHGITFEFIDIHILKFHLNFPTRFIV